MALPTRARPQHGARVAHHVEFRVRHTRQFVRCEVEARDDSEVASAAAKRPEHVGMLGIRHLHDLARRRLGRDDASEETIFAAVEKIDAVAREIERL